MESPKSSNTSQLPPEIWNIIVRFSSPEALATIVSLNRCFHQAFERMLYQDIFIRSAPQLVKLFQSPKAAHNLEEAWRLTIERSVLQGYNWLDICGQLKPAEYLGHVLQMTTSLRDFQVKDARPPGQFEPPDVPFENLFHSEIRQRALDPSFLPQLARIEGCGWARDLLPLYRGRPIEYLSDVTLNRQGPCFHPAGASATRVSLNLAMILDAQGFEYAYMVTRHLRDISLQGITVKHLKVVAIDLGIIMTPAPPPLNLPAWLNAITSENGHEHIESLCIIFDTPRPRKPMDVQLQTLNQAVDRMPNLAYAILGSTDVEWRRHSRDRSGLPSRVPDWTPRPDHRDREILGWWLNMLEPYDAATARKGDPEGVRQLRNSMLARWDEALVPSIEELQMSLSSMASSSV